MKKFLTLLVACASTLAMLAQPVDLSGITWTDFDGETHDLGALQARGPIVLDFWATWCGPCIASIPALEDIHKTFGHSATGDSSIMVFSVEIDDATSNEATIIANEGIENPVIIQEDNTDILPNFDYGGSIPYFVVLCQDGSWESITGSQGDSTTLMNQARACPTSSGLNDDATARGLDVQQTSDCPTGLSDLSYTPSVRVQNAGDNNITSAKVRLFVNGVQMEEVNWTGDLATYESDQVTFGTINNLTGNTDNVSVTIVEVNGGVDADPSNNNTATEKSFGFFNGTTDITLEIDTDSWPEEISWTLEDGSGTVVASAALGDYNGQDNQTISVPITLSSNGCHTFTIDDDFGDGIVDGGYRFVDASSNVLMEVDGGYDEQSVSNFLYTVDTDGEGLNDVVEGWHGTDPNKPDTDDGGVDDLTELENGTDPTKGDDDQTSILDADVVAAFNVFPNPATDQFSVALETVNGDDLSITLINALGQEVRSYEAATGTNTVNAADLNAGIYMIVVRDAGRTVAAERVVLR